MFVLHYEYGVSKIYWKVTIVSFLFGSLILFTLSLGFKTAPTIAICRRLLFAFSVGPPTLLMASTFAFAYLLVAPDALRRYLWSAVIMATVWWCWIALAGYRQRIKDRRFIEREFSFEEDRIVVRQPLKTNLDPAPVGDKTFFGRLYHNFGPYLVMGIPLAYPIQSLLFDAGGTAAVLLLLSILGLPLTLYILGRMACGAYLWVYKVWQLERRHGKPVVFADNN